MLVVSLSLGNITSDSEQTIFMKTIFMSKMKRPVIIVKPMKVNSDNDVVQEPMRVYFENNFYQTEDENVIEFIKKLPNFGADYWIVDEVKKVEDESPKVSVTQMNNPEQEKDARIANLEKQIQEIKGLVLQLASKRVEAPVEVSNDEDDENPPKKVDPLAKAREAKKLKKEEESKE